MGQDHAPDRSIVCGVDLSEDARMALRVAARLARRLGLRLVVVHATLETRVAAAARVPAGRADEGLTSLGDGEVAGRRLQELLEGEGVAGAETRVASGLPAEVIADLADEENAELVVVGSRGQGAIRSAFLGSVSNDLIGIARCPVLVVPRGMSA